MRNSGSCEPRLIVAVSSHSQYHYFVGVYQQSVFPLPMAVGIGLDWIGLQCGCGLLGMQNSRGAGCTPVGRLAVRRVHS